MNYKLFSWIFIVFCSCALKKTMHTSEDLFTDYNKNLWYIAGNDSITHNQFWKLNAGILTCSTEGNTTHPGSWFIFNDTLEDFELQIDFRYNKQLRGNSGIQFRSKLDLDNNKMQGPQIDIHPPLPFRTGLLYDETDGVKHWLYPTTTSWRLEDFPSPKNLVIYDDGIQWNTLVLKCKGTQITTKINGVVLTNFDGEGVLNDTLHKQMGVGMEGLLSIQLHRKHDIFIQFKNCFIKRL